MRHALSTRVRKSPQLFHERPTDGVARRERTGPQGRDFRSRPARCRMAGRAIPQIIWLMRRLTMTKLIALFAATLLSAAAMAQDKPPSDTSSSSSSMKSATFESLDKNSDQQISKTEAAAD